MNSLKQVKTGDWVELNNVMYTFMKWYRRECDNLREIADVWMESEDETIISILSAGLNELRIRTDLMKEADKVKE